MYLFIVNVYTTVQKFGDAFIYYLKYSKTTI